MTDVIYQNTNIKCNCGDNLTQIINKKWGTFLLCGSCLFIRIDDEEELESIRKAIKNSKGFMKLDMNYNKGGMKNDIIEKKMEEKSFEEEKGNL